MALRPLTAELGAWCPCRRDPAGVVGSGSREHWVTPRPRVSQHSLPPGGRGRTKKGLLGLQMPCWELAAQGGLLGPHAKGAERPSGGRWLLRTADAREARQLSSGWGSGDRPAGGADPGVTAHPPTPARQAARKRPGRLCLGSTVAGPGAGPGWDPVVDWEGGWRSGMRGDGLGPGAAITPHPPAGAVQCGCSAVPAGALGGGHPQSRGSHLQGARGGPR